MLRTSEPHTKLALDHLTTFQYVSTDTLQLTHCSFFFVALTCPDVWVDGPSLGLSGARQSLRVSCCDMLRLRGCLGSALQWRWGPATTLRSLGSFEMQEHKLPQCHGASDYFNLFEIVSLFTYIMVARLTQLTHSINQKQSIIFPESV